MEQFLYFEQKSESGQKQVKLQQMESETKALLSIERAAGLLPHLLLKKSSL